MEVARQHLPASIRLAEVMVAAVGLRKQGIVWRFQESEEVLSEVASQRGGMWSWLADRTDFCEHLLAENTRVPRRGCALRCTLPPRDQALQCPHGSGLQDIQIKEQR